MNSFRKYYLFSVIGTLLASFYPLYMGVRVVADMIRDGMVLSENYPKYVIPYTPISLAVITGALLMPVIIRLAKRFALLAASAVSVGVFFAAELLLESKIIVTSTVQTTLESWQMFMCYIQPETFETRTWRAVDVLIGDYSPAFKLHFYVISIILILALLNCLYGFARMIISGDRGRLKSLILQAVSAVTFLGLCIFACFTAFFRTGEITVSPISAALMGAFFVVMGLTAGTFTGSLLNGKKRWMYVFVPAAVSASVTVIMYIGELILLSGHLYRFGEGFFFGGLGALVLAPADLLVILLSGGICALIFALISRSKKREPHAEI